MKTSLPTQEQVRDRKWYLIDAEGKILGHLATKIANLLRGKNKVTFVRNWDMGDHVIVINAAKFKVSGSKLESKQYYAHSMYPGSLKITPLHKLLKERPLKALSEAVVGMIPKNLLRDDAMKRLHLYQEPTHDHEAQKPQVYTF